ncbi:MOSC domain-containing protein [Thalassolituus sp.]|uniref:MOSC domain-containing protein n=1 Tax=Thalassolituus sp. TaxID=2030822 RepID=UPI002A840A90|nr:MOSC N-terminal beta barrel domain-containing protein [Thalassolituus sp.]
MSTPLSPKSCAGTEVDALSFDLHGPRHDRRYVIVKPNGDFLTQRQWPAMAWIKPTVSNDGLNITAPGMEDVRLNLEVAGGRRRVNIWRDELEGDDCGDAIADWLSKYLKTPSRLMRLPQDSRRRVDTDYVAQEQWVGYADGFPLLVISQTSVDFLSAKLGREFALQRFRPNIVVAGAEREFAECDWQSLYLQSVGEIQLVKPCERCVIPTRDLATQTRESDALDVLKNYCRIDGRIVFGQNAILIGAKELSVGQQLSSNDGS